MQKYQWKQYQTLELIPATVTNPARMSFPLSQSLTFLWRSLV